MGLPDYMLPQTVQRVRPSTSTDAFGNVARNYATGTTTSFAAWLEQDHRKALFVEGREPQEQYWLLMANESDIATSDHIVFDSMTFEVFGPPEKVYTPAGYHHLECTLRKVAG